MNNLYNNAKAAFCEQYCDTSAAEFARYVKDTADIYAMPSERMLAFINCLRHLVKMARRCQFITRSGVDGNGAVWCFVLRASG